ASTSGFPASWVRITPFNKIISAAKLFFLIAQNRLKKRPEGIGTSTHGSLFPHGNRFVSPHMMREDQFIVPAGNAVDEELSIGQIKKSAQMNGGSRSMKARYENDHHSCETQSRQASAHSNG
ncbi:MAG: hypothetical protein P8Y00_02580, partial [Deltaproteobacteria bacterium]